MSQKRALSPSVFWLSGSSYAELTVCGPDPRLQLYVASIRAGLCLLTTCTADPGAAAGIDLNSDVMTESAFLCSHRPIPT